MILESVENGPLLWPTVKENGVTRLPPEVYALVSTHKVSKELWERIQMLMQGTSLTKQDNECKLYDEFDKFAYRKGESVCDFYLRFSLLLNDMNIYIMKLEQFQYTSQAPSSTPLSITYPSNDFQLSVNHNVYNVSSLIPQMEYALAVHPQSEFSQPDTGLVVLVFQKVNSKEPNLSSSTTIVEVPKELPKVIMVNSSLKKFKFYLASFDVVVKERTTATAITKGTWGFEHTKACFRDEIIPFVKALKDLFNSFYQFLIDELTKVQNVFNQMEQAVEQYCVEKNKFQDKMKNILKDNERLLEQAISVDIVNIIVHDHVNSASLKHTLTKIKGKYVVNEAVPLRSIDRELVKIDVAPLAYKLHNNRTVHIDYLRHTQEENATLREIIESERLLNPLNTSLDYASKYTKRIQELLIILKQTCPCINDLGTKLMAVTPKSHNKKIRFTKHIPLLGNTPVKTTSSTNVVSNTPVLSSTGVNLLSSASRSQPQGNTKNDRIQRKPSKAKKNKLEDHS
nr:hypothetical protein [Tanacetum cinerariifolium]